MAVTRTFAQLSLAVQQLGQWENSTDITPAVLLQAINYALIEGYDMMVQKWADYYTVSTTFAIAAGTDTYSLSTITSAAFYKLRHLDVSSDGVRYRRCLPHDHDAAYRYTGGATTTIDRVRYRLQGASLVFVPVPPAGFGKMFYIPTPVQFTGVSDVTPVTFDVPTEERLIINLAFRDLLTRSDLNTNSVDAYIGRLAALLRTAADSRDAGQAFSLNPNGPPRDYADNDEDWY